MPHLRSPLLPLALLLALVAPAAAQVTVFSITATANTGADAFGYTVGHPYEFVFTLTNASPAGDAGAAVEYPYISWDDGDNAEPLLGSVTGSGLLADYVRPSDANGSLEVRPTDDFTPTFGQLKWNFGSDSGLEVAQSLNGTALGAFDLYVLTPLGAFAAPYDGTPPGPNAYFSAYTGPVTFESGTTFTLSTTNYDSIDFTVTSIEISQTAVPEPATYAFWAGSVGLVGVALLRRWKIAT